MATTVSTPEVARTTSSTLDHWLRRQPAVPPQLNSAVVGEHPVWDRAFNAAIRDQLLNEDLNAGRRVCGLLISIVTIGMLLMAATVTVCVALAG